jgi:hypothetical protein
MTIEEYDDLVLLKVRTCEGCYYSIDPKYETEIEIAQDHYLRGADTILSFYDIFGFHHRVYVSNIVETTVSTPESRRSFDEYTSAREKQNIIN